MKTALIVVDVQNDFCPGGALAVPNGDEIIAGINRVIDTREYEGVRLDLLIATQDYHPSDHKSFAANHPGKQVLDVIELFGKTQVLWPRHCEQGHAGAEFHPALSQQFDLIVQKGLHPEVDSYSGFFDNGKLRETGLHAYLQGAGVTGLYVCGLATDYCVSATAIDGADLGYKVHFIESLSRGVGIQPEDIENRIGDMQAHGVEVLP